MDVRLVAMGVGKLVTVTPSDDTNIGNTLGLYIGTPGDVAVTPVDMPDGTRVVLKNLEAGRIHPLMVKRVWATDTTAQDILAVY